jgi:hypothetical protein
MAASGRMGQARGPADCEALKSSSGCRIQNALVGSDLPIIASRVFDHRAPIAIRHVGRFFERHGTSFQCALVRRVGVIDVEIQEDRSRGARTHGAHHDNRVPDSDLRRCLRREISARGKRMPKKLDQAARVRNDQPRSNAVPAIGALIAFGEPLARRHGKRSPVSEMPKT